MARGRWCIGYRTPSLVSPSPPHSLFFITSGCRNSRQQKFFNLASLVFYFFIAIAIAFDSLPGPKSVEIWLLIINICSMAAGTHHVCCCFSLAFSSFRFLFLFLLHSRIHTHTQINILIKERTHMWSVNKKAEIEMNWGNWQAIEVKVPLNLNLPSERQPLVYYNFKMRHKKMH